MPQKPPARFGEMDAEEFFEAANGGERGVFQVKIGIFGVKKGQK